MFKNYFLCFQDTFKQVNFPLLGLYIINGRFKQNTEPRSAVKEFLFKILFKNYNNLIIILIINASPAVLLQMYMTFLGRLAVHKINFP